MRNVTAEGLNLEVRWKRSCSSGGSDLAFSQKHESSRKVVVTLRIRAGGETGEPRNNEMRPPNGNFPHLCSTSGLRPTNLLKIVIPLNPWCPFFLTLLFFPSQHNMFIILLIMFIISLSPLKCKLYESQVSLQKLWCTFSMYMKILKWRRFHIVFVPA